MARVRGEIPTPESLGRMLQQGRLLRGMSQRDLADHLGIGQKWVWQMESGKPGLLTERLFATLRATGVSLHAEIDVPDDVPEAPDANPATPREGTDTPDAARHG
jgi:HTH-type transcriptional regulator/antitoxin HipB